MLLLMNTCCVCCSTDVANGHGTEAGCDLSEILQQYGQGLVTISVVALTIGWGEGTGLQMFHDFLMQEWCKGMLDDLCCLGATTSKHGGELAVREHGLAESGEAMCNLCNHAGRECCVLP